MEISELNANNIVLKNSFDAMEEKLGHGKLSLNCSEFEVTRLLEKFLELQDTVNVFTGSRGV